MIDGTKPSGMHKEPIITSIKRKRSQAKLDEQQDKQEQNPIDEPIVKRARTENDATSQQTSGVKRKYSEEKPDEITTNSPSKKSKKPLKELNNSWVAAAVDRIKNLPIRHFFITSYTNLFYYFFPPSRQTLNGTLLDAANRNDIKMINFCLDHGANIEVVETIKRKTALHMAASQGHIAAVKLLIERGANVDSRVDKFYVVKGATPLHLAAEKNHIAIIHLLIEKGANTQATCGKRLSSSWTPLMSASAKGNSEAVKILLENKQDYSLSEEALKVAVQEKQLEVVKIFLEYGIKISDGLLHIAASKADIPMMELLLAAGTNIQASANSGYGRICTALHKAVESSSLDAVKLLLDRGANMEVSDSVGRTALNHAVFVGKYLIVEELLRRGAMIECLDIYGFSPLHIAARNNNPLTVKALLKNGANVKATNKEGYTPLHTAANEGSFLAVSELLTAKDIDINACTPDGYSALHLVVKNSEYCKSSSDYPKIARILILGGIDINLQTHDGSTVCKMASSLVSSFGFSKNARAVMQVLALEGAIRENRYYNPEKNQYRISNKLREKMISKRTKELKDNALYYILSYLHATPFDFLHIDLDELEHEKTTLAQEFKPIPDMLHFKMGLGLFFKLPEELKSYTMKFISSNDLTYTSTEDKKVTKIAESRVYHISKAE